MMTTRLANAALVASCLAAPALAGPGTCMAGANDEASGQMVVVRFKVDAGGAITNREAEWDHTSPGPARIAGLTLKIRYEPPANDALGPVTTVSLYVIGRGPFTGASATLEAGGKRWSAPLNAMFGTGIAQFSRNVSWGPPLNPDLARNIEGLNVVTVSLKDAKKQTLASLAVNPADHATRDRLFSEAGARAAQLVAAPAPCQ
jgi:hypothetical protein